MKKIKIYIAIIGTLMLLTNCSPTFSEYNQNQIQKAKAMWINEREATLIDSWGLPNSRSSDGYNGEILTYRRFNGYITWVTNYYVNSNKIIYNLNAYSE
jgi:hypothetical protein